MVSRLIGRPRVTYLLKHFSLKTRQLQTKLDRAKKRVLIRQAAYCKGVARRMIRPAKAGDKNSDPGKPPRMHNGSKLFKLSINWGYSNAGGYSVAGPAQVTNRNVPAALHKGGRSVAIRKGRRVSQKVKARPFMNKALAITLKSFPGGFRGSVK